jgi:SAM-dependent methyltransferase
MPITTVLGVAVEVYRPNAENSSLEPISSWFAGRTIDGAGDMSVSAEVVFAVPSAMWNGGSGADVVLAHRRSPLLDSGHGRGPECHTRRMSARTSLTGKIRHAVAHPGRVLPHLRRTARNSRLRGPGHTAFYRAVMADEARRDPDRAVGSDSRDSWLQVGQIQYDYLIRHGLRPEHRLLDIGCGNLRAGWRLARYLDPGHYTGIDISPDILLAALDTVREYDLQDQRPLLTVVGDLRLDWLPAEHFDVVHAHSVFSHTPLNVVDEALGGVGRVLRPGGWFDFTYFDGPSGDFLREDFWHPTEQLLDLARSHRLRAESMADWDYHQEKIRVTRS